MTCPVIEINKGGIKMNVYEVKREINGATRTSYCVAPNLNDVIRYYDFKPCNDVSIKLIGLDADIIRNVNYE